MPMMLDRLAVFVNAQYSRRVWKREENSERGHQIIRCQVLQREVLQNYTRPLLCCRNSLSLSPALSREKEEQEETELSLRRMTNPWTTLIAWTDGSQLVSLGRVRQRDGLPIKANR